MRSTTTFLWQLIMLASFCLYLSNSHSTEVKPSNSVHEHKHHHHTEHKTNHKHTHDHHHDHDHHDHHHESHDEKVVKKVANIWFIWAEALFATALVGVAPIVVLMFVPLNANDLTKQKATLRVFLGFAAGGLLGDSFLHLLPHAVSPHDHSHSGHDHGSHGHSHSVADLSVWLWTLLGIVAFLMLEKFVRSYSGHSHGHSHGNVELRKKNDDLIDEKYQKGKKLEPDSDRLATLRSRKNGQNKKESKESEKNIHPQKESCGIAAAGYLNLAADFSHNFTDGLAIGATFLQGTGWQTTIAMLLHEVPHEIGDYAILLQSGFSKKSAMLAQFGTALGAMVGTVVGLLLEGAGNDGASWISPFTAGGFIYIACSSVFPELLEDCSFWQSLKEGIAILAGIGLMIVIALYE